jgi:hypothetical protein
LNSKAPANGIINFLDHEVTSYGGPAQDVGGSVSIEDGGATLHLTGNVWKKIDVPYSVTEYTVLEFDFRSTSQGEIHGIGLDTDLSLSADRTFELYGTQDWANADFEDYESSAPGYKHYQVPIGQYYTGQMDYLFFANDHDVANPTAVSFFSNVRLLESQRIDFHDYVIASYGGPGQDVGGSASVEDGGATLHLTGNVWKKIDFSYSVTENTVLEFDFKSTSQGEIHGIGLDADLSISADRTFELYGTQDWANSDFEDYRSTAPDYKHYRIPIGQYYTGQMVYLFFANDHDVANPTGASFFSNVRLLEKQGVNFHDYVIASYGVPGQDVQGSAIVEDDGATLHLTGNVWKKIDLPYSVTENSLLEFDFKSASQGEIHGLGLDTDLSMSVDRTFELYGTQNWANLDFKDYASAAPGYKHYQIPIGQYFTGQMDYLFFVNDHDVSNPNAESFFRNVRLYEG